MTTPEPLSEADIRMLARYWRQPTGYQQEPAGMVGLARYNINQLVATIDALRAERDRLRAIVDSHLSAQSDLDALGVMTARAEAAEERADGWESLIAGSAEATDAVAARRRQIEDWRRGAERAEAAEAALAEARRANGEMALVFAEQLDEINALMRRAEAAESDWQIAESDLAEAVELLRRRRDRYHVAFPCDCEVCGFLAARAGLEAPSIVRRHQDHYQVCNCLDDSDICCVESCPCHEEAPDA